MRNFITIIIALLIFVASALFFAQNDSMVMIDYFSGQVEWQLNWVMVLCIIVGFLLGVASLFGSLMKTKFLLKQARIKLDKHQKELNSLRSLPLKDDY
ncbi:lipopolysaccharide assembly protein LapA domain-containing protein [Aliikangiella sp. G2MR2-5]|uniref:lipopolysaccharide assembly protein LapA domain-containing protein n=1 Tax=Aliikangiella sp. G2MR2-5 TaxID=2788943 RepID=UPI0018AC2223|nr:LapA family protein [Aliikangiella sp. G2MR2-5]